MQNIRLTEEARQDLLSGKAFYDGLQPGVGSWFFDSLISDIESLCIYAGVHEKHFGAYRLLARRFPYAIYYQINDRNVAIFAGAAQTSHQKFIRCSQALSYRVTHRE